MEKTKRAVSKSVGMERRRVEGHCGFARFSIENSKKF
jgi:hypothetical protein